MTSIIQQTTYSPMLFQRFPKVILAAFPCINTFLKLLKIFPKVEEKH